MPLIMHSKWLLLSGAARSRMHRNVVNSRTANIFKRILESWNSTGNGKRFAKMRRRKMCGSAVNLARINHAAPVGKLHPLLIPISESPESRRGFRWKRRRQRFPRSCVQRGLSNPPRLALRPAPIAPLPYISPVHAPACASLTDSRMPTALRTASKVLRVGLPLGDNARYKDSRLIPASAATAPSPP